MALDDPWAIRVRTPKVGDGGALIRSSLLALVWLPYFERDFSAEDNQPIHRSTRSVANSTYGSVAT